MEMQISDDGALSFEAEAARLERIICNVPDLICECCETKGDQVCPSCVHATSFHFCERLQRCAVWRKGTLYGRKVDYQRVLYNLHRTPGSVAGEKNQHTLHRDTTSHAERDHYPCEAPRQRPPDRSYQKESRRFR